MATFGVLKSRVSKTLTLDETAEGREDVLVGYELNDAVRDFLIRTRCNVNVATDTIDTTGGDQDLSANALLVLDLKVAGTTASDIWLPERTSLAEILRMRRVTGSGGARYYAHDGSLWSFYPDLVAGNVVTLYYVPKPTEMTVAANDPSAESYGGIPVEFHPALIQYALWKMADYDDDGISQNGIGYQAQYEKLVRDARRWMQFKGGRTMGRAVLGNRRVRVPLSPSQTWD